MTQVMAARETRLCFNALIGKCLSCIPLKEVWVEAEAIQEIPWNYRFSVNAGSNFLTKTGKTGKLDRETLLTKSEKTNTKLEKTHKLQVQDTKTEKLLFISVKTELSQKLAKSVKPKTQHPPCPHEL